MSEDPAFQEPAEASEPTAQPASSGRGRPRPQATLDRDDRVRKALQAGPKTKKELVEELQMSDKDVYASLWRLRHYDNEVRRVEGSSTWEYAGV